MFKGWQEDNSPAMKDWPNTDVQCADTILLAVARNKSLTIYGVTQCVFFNIVDEYLIRYIVRRMEEVGLVTKIEERSNLDEVHISEYGWEWLEKRHPEVNEL